MKQAVLKKDMYSLKKGTVVYLLTKATGKGCVQISDDPKDDEGYGVNVSNLHILKDEPVISFPLHV